jgi:hypothetical protein
MVFNIDYIKRKTSDLASLDIADTDVAWLSSDSEGTCDLNFNTREYVDILRDFVAAGGVLIADLASECASFAVAPMADNGVFDLGLGTNPLDAGPTRIPDLPVENGLAATPNNLDGLAGNFDDIIAVGMGIFQVSVACVTRQCTVQLQYALQPCSL